MVLDGSFQDTNDTFDLDCPNYDENAEDLLDFFSFWIEGILTTIVAILGIFGNTIVSVIICKKDMRNSFNLLLVSLACFDSTYVSTIPILYIATHFSCFLKVLKNFSALWLHFGKFS